MLSPEDYIALYEKYQAGKCTPEELRLLYTYPDRFRFQSSLEPTSEEEAAGMHTYRQIQQIIHHKPYISRMRWWMIAGAASVLLLAGVWAVFRQQSDVILPANQQLSTNSVPIKPGRNTATLTLASGKTIVLDDVQQGEIAKEAGVSIHKSANGQLIYTVQQQEETTSPSYQTIATPRGGQYQIILPDSTKVWLNASSSLRYPANFTGKERLVELSGEAYFEVAKRVKQPFRVKTATQELEVLGTTFNVCAYPEEGLTTTVVASGAVSVLASGASQKQRILRAGDQNILNNQTHEMQLSQANLTQMLSWKNGYFIFDNSPLSEIMNKIARWYDIEVAYEGNVQQRKFGGTFNRHKDFADLLSGLEFSGNVHFKIEGRRVTVMP